MSETSKHLSPQAFNAYLIEYQVCAETYRHTYQTIWQACAVFSVISAAMITIAKPEIQSYVQKFSLLPIIFWYFGIFTPMNKYGEQRATRLAEIEDLLSSDISDLEMKHFRDFNKYRKKITLLQRISQRRWRVNHFAHLFGILIVICQILFWIK